MKKISMVMVLLLTFILVGCGTSSTKSTAQQKASNKETTLLEKVKNNGELLIGTEGTYPPFTFHDSKTGDLTGFDVDLAREVAKRIGVKPVFKESKWDAMFAGLNSKRFDMIANEVGIRPDRQKKYAFSDPYISSSAVLVARKDNHTIKGFNDLKGLKSAQSLTSNYATIAKQHGATIVSVDGFNEAMQLLASKRVDVTINDKLSVLDYLNQKKDAPIKIVAQQNKAAESAFMFRKGNESLVEAVNNALKSMKKDGTYLKISKKWFGQDVSK